MSLILKFGSLFMVPRVLAITGKSLSRRAKQHVGEVYRFTERIAAPVGNSLSVRAGTFEKTLPAAGAAA